MTEYTLQSRSKKPLLGFSTRWRDCLGGYSTNKDLILERFDRRRTNNTCGVVFRVVKRSDEAIALSTGILEEEE
jgi:hypothetical protein